MNSILLSQRTLGRVSSSSWVRILLKKCCQGSSPTWLWTWGVGWKCQVIDNLGAQKNHQSSLWLLISETIDGFNCPPILIMDPVEKWQTPKGRKFCFQSGKCCWRPWWTGRKQFPGEKDDNVITHTQVEKVLGSGTVSMARTSREMMKITVTLLTHWNFYSSCKFSTEKPLFLTQQRFWRKMPTFGTSRLKPGKLQRKVVTINFPMCPIFLQAEQKTFAQEMSIFHSKDCFSISNPRH